MTDSEILYDHYKETMRLSKDAQRDRDKFFIIVCLLIALLFLLKIEPDGTVSTFKNFANEAFKVNIEFSFGILQSAVWIILLFYTLRYYQKNIYIERQYKYLGQLEQALSANMNCIFDRESNNYLDSYPLVLNIIHYSYTILFPVLYLLVVSMKLYHEWITSFSPFNTIVSLSVIILTIAYLSFLHKGNIKTWWKERKKTT